MMARKRKKKKKADAQMTEISVSTDGDFGETKMTDSVLMTESWQVWVDVRLRVPFL